MYEIVLLQIHHILEVNARELDFYGRCRIQYFIFVTVYNENSVISSVQNCNSEQSSSIGKVFRP